MRGQMQAYMLILVVAIIFQSQFHVGTVYCKLVVIALRHWHFYTMASVELWSMNIIMTSPPVLCRLCIYSIQSDLYIDIVCCFIS